VLFLSVFEENKQKSFELIIISDNLNSTRMIVGLSVSQHACIIHDLNITQFDGNWDVAVKRQTKQVVKMMVFTERFAMLHT
jgi:hypothetical protein